MFKKYACTLQHDQSDCAAAVGLVVYYTGRHYKFW